MQVSTVRSTRTLTVAIAGLALAAGSVLMTGSPAAAGQSDPAGDVRDTPGQESTDDEWRAWATALEEEVRITDWAADSAARGCELVSIDITDTTVPEDQGAPAGLTIPLVERSEDCTTASSLSQQRATGSFSALASACTSTSGPGTICLSRSGSYVTSSFTYRGSSSPNGFVRIYQRSSSSGCGTGSTIATGGSYTYSNGETHSVSAYAGYGHYSGSFWRKTTFGHTNWGTVCDSL
ncbi:hypothetical protein LQF12_05860 [Ruania suaedae]|uniref:hypothetical protein n=1 Tax=Ruania suaedae TaxID=2897774 RepID=UPI001E31A441|nr:hypothetical protein [Ruania suaedae]UFU04111.1 hypothetical protein LQF12_05860 [Ruania suaedae]